MLSHLTLKTKLLLSATTLGLALGVAKGCGDTVEPLLLDLESLQLALDDISKVVDQHPKDAQASASIAAWKDVEVRDRGRLVSPMAEMNRLLGTMGRMCTGPAGSPDLAPLRNSAAALTAGVQAHAQAVSGATERTTAPLLESQYSGQITGLVSTLRAQATAMERTGASYTCEVHNP